MSLLTSCTILLFLHFSTAGAIRSVPNINVDPNTNVDTPRESSMKEFVGILGKHVEHTKGKGRLVAKLMPITLVISLFVPSHGRQEHPHFQETYAAFAANMNNPLITNIHVLLEAPSKDCSILEGKVLNATRRHMPNLSKLRCIKVDRQPTYGDFLEHANTVHEGTAMIANADVVFDETLSLLPHMEVGNDVTIISVRPPPYDGKFADIFGKPCRNSAVRCIPDTKSWDVYAFQPPLPAALPISKLQFQMNVINAENRAAAAMRSIGLELRNPCMHVHAYHWHCFGGKTHAEFPKHATFVAGDPHSYPCQDFPSDEACLRAGEQPQAH
jgi:hypothetical protein